MTQALEIAVFGGGCFWCTEAVFSELKGVRAVMPGYAGGSVPNPTYEQVSGGTTGHAEVIRVEYDPDEISYEDLLTVFFASHDPTQLNRQGADVGTQYRSTVLFTNEAQRKAAEAFIAKLNEDPPIGEARPEGGGPKAVTEVAPLNEFYPAEDYHRDYYRNNSSAPYCQLVINPKMEKLKERYARLLRNNN